MEELKQQQTFWEYVGNGWSKGLQWEGKAKRGDGSTR
jgi:hypothetical protein